jgi:hypothetical protein
MAQDVDAKTKTGQVAADKGPYPPYELTFEGDLVVAPGSHIEGPLSVRGSHSFNLPAAAPEVGIRVVVTQEDHDPGVPHLKITIRRKKTGDPK